MKSYNVVFHIKEIEKWDLLIKNVLNLLEAMKSIQIKVEVVANGEAVPYFDYTNRIETDIYNLKTLNENDVEIVVFINAQKAIENNRGDFFHIIVVITY